MSDKRKIFDLEFPIDLRLSAEVWFGYGNGKDISVTILQDGANEIVSRHYSFDELYADLFAGEEPIERLKAQSKRAQANHAKKVLKRMKKFVESKGIKK